MKKSIVLGSLFLLGIAPFTCTPQDEDWGMQAIDKLPTPVDPPLQCSFALPEDSQVDARDACQFGQGDHPSRTLDLSAALGQQMPIRHVIVMMKENRSYDHLYGNLHDEGQPDSEPIPPDYSNTDAQGVVVAPFHEATTCVPNDPGHQSAAVAAAIHGGKMDGFVKSAAETTPTDGHYVMGNYNSTDLPFYYWLANNYALSDRHFAPMASGTFANRSFYMLGTNAGVVDTGITYPDPSTPSIFSLLLTAGYTWRVYTDSEPLSGAFNWNAKTPGVRPFNELLTALDEGTLPNVAFVDGVDSVTDDHPTADLQAGEAWSRMIYAHAVNSPQWSRLAIVFTFDEAGNFADHMTPPAACRALPSSSEFTAMGPRIPLVMISRWAKPHYVSHVVHDHVAITRLIETLFDLPALTARDANSDALMDLFDFSCDQPVVPPQPAPAAGKHGCPRLAPVSDTE